MESELKNPPEPTDIPVQNDIQIESNRTLFFLIGIFVLALVLLIYTVTRKPEPKNDKAYSNVILEVFSLTEWEVSEARKMGGYDTHLLWNNSDYPGSYIVSYPDEESLYLKTSKNEMTVEEADLFIKNITNVFSKHKLEKDSTRKMISPWSGGALFEDSEIWSDGTEFYFVIKVNLWDDTWGKYYYVEFGYLGTVKNIKELEKEQYEILSAIPVNAGYEGKYIYVDSSRNILKETIFENEQETRMLVWLTHQSTEPQFFYYSQNKETKEIAPLIWEEDNEDVYINIKTCDELIGKGIVQSEFPKLIETVKEGFGFKDFHFDHLMNCFD